MRILNKMLAFILIVGLTLTTAHIISAQQSGGRPGTGRRPGTGGRPGGDRQMDPAAMMDRMIERRMENITEGMQEMNIPDNEAGILKTQIEALLRMRMAPNTEMTQATETLQKAVDEKKDDAQIRAALDAVKAKRKEQKAKDEKAEKELLEILPLKLEALLTVQGTVNGGTGGGGMGFGRRGFGGGRGQGRQGGGAGGQRRQRGNDG